MKWIYSILSFVFISLSTYAQLPTAPNVIDDNGNRQGEWVIYYDAGWEEIEDATNAEFYRKISYENDKPIGLVTDFYLNGIKQWEGELASDRPDFANGISRYYYDNGNIESEGLMKRNKRSGEWNNFLYDGTFSHNSNTKESISNIISNHIHKANHYVKKNQEKTIQYIQEALKYVNTLPDSKMNEHLSFCLLQIGDIYRDLEMHADAIVFYSKCLAIDENTFGYYSDDYVFTLDRLAFSYYLIGDINESIKLFEECVSIRKKVLSKNHPSLLYSLKQLYDSYSLSETKTVEELVSFKADIVELEGEVNGKQSVSYVDEIIELALLYSDLGNCAKSMEMNEAALEVYDQMMIKKDYNYLTLITNLAFDYGCLSKLDDELKLQQLALELSKDIYGEKHEEYASSLCNLASVYINLEEEKKSLELNAKALEIYKKIYGINSFDYSRVLNNMALAYSNLGDYKRSYEFQLNSLNIIKEIYGKYSDDYAAGLNNLALDLLNHDDKTKESVELQYESIGIFDSIFGIDNSYSLARYEILGVTQMIVNDYNAADSLFVKSLNFKIDNYFTNSYYLSENEKSEFLESLSYELTAFASYSSFRKKPELIDVLGECNLKIKGILLSSTMRIVNKINELNDNDITSQFNEWKGGKIQLGYLYEHPSLDKDYINEVKKLEEKVNFIERKLSSYLTNYNNYSFESIIGKLSDEEVFVDIIRTFNFNYDSTSNDEFISENRYDILVYNPNNDGIDVVSITNGDALESLGYQYYSSHTAGSNKQNLDEYSFLSYWKAIADKLEGKKRVYVSSDGVYNKINLNVLYNKETKKYLGEEMDIHLVTSGRDLFKTYPEEEKELTAVLVGSPMYDLIKEEKEEEDLLVSRDLQQYWIDSLSRGFSVTSLPGTAVEVKNISEILKKNKWEVTSYTEEEALEGKVKIVSSPTVLHIATHGYFFEDVAHEKESPTRLMGVDSEKATQNPLLRSGLLFVGAKNTLNGNGPESGDNGLLTAYEASYMDLRGTELVVLSACETARGEIKNGEGVYGLQRAIQQAGAENIIMSMWKVDDKVTQEFMTMFYEKWLSGSTKREAFKSTQQQIKETYKHPYYWGAFVMIGR